MSRTIIDEYVLSKLLHKICPTKFTEEWLHVVRIKHSASLIASDNTAEHIPANHGDHLVIQCRLTDNGAGIIGSTNNGIIGSTNNPVQSQYNQEAGVGGDQQRSAPSSDEKNSILVRDRGLYIKNLKDTVRHIANNQQKQPQADVTTLLHDIQTYFQADPVPVQSSGSKSTLSVMGDMFGTITLDSDDNEQRQRHFSSISDGSSSSDSSVNFANYQQFESILQRIFKLTQLAGGSLSPNRSGADNCAIGKVSWDQFLPNPVPAPLPSQGESNEELSSGYGRSSTASSNSLDSANPLSSAGNAPTLGSLAVNIGSVPSDSGNGSPTGGFFPTKNSSSASSLTQEPSNVVGLNLKDYLDDNVTEMKRERLNTNPMDELFRFTGHTTARSTSLSAAHDSQLPPLTKASPGLFYPTAESTLFEPTDRSCAGAAAAAPSFVNRSASSWLTTPTTICQEASTFSDMNPCFVMSTGDRTVNRRSPLNLMMNRSFSVGARDNSPILSSVSASRADYNPYIPVDNLVVDVNRRKFYELIASQLLLDGYDHIANQLIESEALVIENVFPNSALYNLYRCSTKNDTNERDPFSSQAYDIFNSNDFEDRNQKVISPLDSSFAFDRSNSASLTMATGGTPSIPSIPTIPPSKMFIANRSFSQAPVTNTMDRAAITSPQPATAPVLHDSNFMLNETGLKNINQLILKFNHREPGSQFQNPSPLPANNNFMPRLITPPARANQQNPVNGNTPSHTTGNGKFHRELTIKAKFGSLGSGVNQFSSPHGFCLGFNEELVIADTSNHRICVYDKLGKLKSTFGNVGREEGQLFNPRKIATITLTRGGVESQCYVICDRGSERSRMQIFTRNGVFVRKILITFMEIVAGIVINSLNEIVVIDSVHPTVFALNDRGDLQRFFDCSGQMCEPSDIAFFKEEYYICDFKGHCICVYTLEGDIVRKIGSQNNTYFPNGIDISPKGDLLVGDSHGNRFHMAVFDNKGQLLTEYECPHVKVSRCCGLKLTREGYIVTLAKNNHHVLVLNSLA